MARVTLCSCPSVYGDCRGARVLDHPGELRCVAVAVVPARAHFDRHRDLDGCRHRPDDSGGVVGLAHQAAAGLMLGNLGHRAAHVHIHNIGAHRFDNLGRRRHLGRIPPENLDRDRPLFRRVLGVFQRAVDASDQSFRADHLGHDEPAPTMTLDEPPERGVGHPRHRRNAERFWQPNAADLNRVRLVQG